MYSVHHSPVCEPPTQVSVRQDTYNPLYVYTRMAWRDTHNKLHEQFQNSFSPGKSTWANVRENWTSPRLTMDGGISFRLWLEG
jgi:hypothetical protein